MSRYMFMFGLSGPAVTENQEGSLNHHMPSPTDKRESFMNAQPAEELQKRLGLRTRDEGLV